MENRIKKHLRPDHQMFDKVTVETTPRFKESEMSGCEWRISANIKYWCKGKIVWESRPYRDIGTALDFIKSEYHLGCDNGREFIKHENQYCDQEGCENLPDVVYKMKQQFNRDGDLKSHQFEQHRSFCNKHKNRGDSSLNDGMQNYEVYPT